MALWINVGTIETSVEGVRNRYREKLRRMSMVELMAELAESRRWWAANSSDGALDLTPLIEEEMRVRV